MFKAIVVIAILVVTCHAEGPDRSKWLPVVCSSRGTYTLDERLGAEVRACGMAACHSHCEGEALGLMTDHEFSPRAIYHEFANVIAPVHYKELAHAHINSCFQKFRPNDEKFANCEVEDNWGSCLWDVLKVMPC